MPRAAINPTAHKKEATAGERRRRLAAAQAAQEVLAGMHAHVLAQTGRLDQALSVLEGRVSKNRDLCLAYLRMLRGTDPEKARRGALDAVAAHPDDVQVIDAAIESVPPDAPERVRLLGNAFEATGERSYLQEIKRATDDWESVAVGLIERLAGRSMDKAIDVCTKEGMHGKAMEMLEKNGDVGAFKKYTKRLGKSQPERYVAAYGRALESFAKGRSGKEHYQRIADHLESIIEIARFRGGRQGNRRAHQAAKPRQAQPGSDTQALLHGQAFALPHGTWQDGEVSGRQAFTLPHGRRPADQATRVTPDPAHPGGRDHEILSCMGRRYCQETIRNGRMVTAGWLAQRA